MTRARLHAPGFRDVAEGGAPGSDVSAYPLWMPAFSLIYLCTGGSQEPLTFGPQNRYSSSRAFLHRTKPARFSSQRSVEFAANNLNRLMRLCLISFNSRNAIIFVFVIASTHTLPPVRAEVYFRMNTVVFIVLSCAPTSLSNIQIVAMSISDGEEDY